MAIMLNNFVFWGHDDIGASSAISRSLDSSMLSHSSSIASLVVVGNRYYPGFELDSERCQAKDGAQSYY